MNENIENVLDTLDGFRTNDEMTYSAYSTLHDEISLLDDLLQPTVGGWISVKDRMPESRHAVLVYTPHYKNIWAVSMHEDGNWYIWSPNGRVLLDPDWHGPITHWMPFPEPPKNC